MFFDEFSGGLPILSNYDVTWKVYFSVEVGKIFHEKWLNLDCLRVKLFIKIKKLWHQLSSRGSCHSYVVIPAPILQNSNCFARGVKIFMLPSILTITKQ